MRKMSVLLAVAIIMVCCLSLTGVAATQDKGVSGSWAGRRTGGRQIAPPLTLPADYDFHDSFFTQDLRLSHSFPLWGELVRLLACALRLTEPAPVFGGKEKAKDHLPVISCRIQHLHP